MKGITCNLVEDPITTHSDSHGFPTRRPLVSRIDLLIALVAFPSIVNSAHIWFGEEVFVTGKSISIVITSDLKEATVRLCGDLESPIGYK
jgi:hypothetical protein